MDHFGHRHGNSRWVPSLFMFTWMLVCRAAVGQSFDALHEFSPGAGHPRSALVAAVNGTLFGTTFDGGLYGKGSIYVLTPDGVGGFSFAETYSFTGGADGNNPEAALVEGTDGSLYGALSGGTSGQGLIYRVDSGGGNFEVLHELSGNEGSFPGGAFIQGSDGLLYGAAIAGGEFGYGTLFAFDPLTASLTVIHSFAYADGGYPRASLLEGSDGALYGVTFAGGSGFSSTGVVFRLDKSGANFSVLHELTSQEAGSVWAALIQLPDGFLYGVGSSGGASFQGTVFKLDTSGSGFEVLHELSGSDGQFPLAPLVAGPDGLLYGTTPYTSNNNFGTLFRLDTSGTTFELLHTFANAEGISPAAGLLPGASNSFYGTTQYGGAGGNGTVFQYAVSTGVAVVHSFVSSDGFRPGAALVRGPGGYLYGTTGNGGTSGFGTVFRMDSAGNSYSLLHSFSGPDGAYPVSPLVASADGRLYGTTNGGGAANFGTVFRLEPGTGAFAVLHEFTNADGQAPLGGVIQAADGFLYGATVNGGANGTGVLYRLRTSGQNFSVLHEFVDSGPQAALLQGSDGRLYGTTYYGGAQGYGTVFRVDTSGQNFSVIHSFTHEDGAFPASALIQLPDGKLYGTTSSGTAAELGVIFKLGTSGNQFAVIHQFSGPDGAFSYAPLFAASDGFLYGATFGGGPAGAGTIFRIKPGGGDFAIHHGFAGTDGSAPFAAVIQGADGALYGTARDGGSLGGGVAFRLDRAFYRLAVSKSGTGSGNVVSSPAGINCGATCSSSFAAASTVALTATPSSNSLFGGWTGDPDCSDASVTMTGDKGCTAVFKLGPDLIVQVLGAPASGQHGMSLTINSTTKNTGAAGVGSSTTQFVLSVDAIPDAADVVLGSRTVPALAAGASNQGAVTVTIPSAQPPGNYYLIAIADAAGARAETNETNNARSRKITIH